MRVQLVGGKWPLRWMPRDCDTPGQESFTAWWSRVREELGHLDPRVLEQWIHRHWTHTVYRLDLLRLTSELRKMSTEEILSSVGSVDDFRPEDREVDSEALVRTFNPSGEPFEPAATMNATGSWNIPIVVLESPAGFAYGDRATPDVRLWLIEGHLRFRYLRALVSTGRPVAREHDVLLLTLAPGTLRRMGNRQRPKPRRRGRRPAPRAL